MEITLNFTGDQLVGIPGGEFIITTDSYDISDYNKNERDELRKEIKKFFVDTFDLEGSVWVMFEDEE